MIRHIKTWGSRSLVVVLLVVGVQHWGMPVYKKYLTPKETKVFVPTTKAKAGKFVISFHEMGTLEAENSTVINAPYSGKIIELAPEGTEVKPGDTVVVMDTEEIEKEIQQLELVHAEALVNVDRAETELNILKEKNKTEIDQAQAQLQFDEAELERAKAELKKKKELAAEKLIPKSQVDDAELKVRSQDLAVRKGRMNLALKEKEVESQERQKQADLDHAKNVARRRELELNDRIARLSQSVVTAPASGMVVAKEGWIGGSRRKAKEGDTLWHGRTICELPDLSSMLVGVQIGESDAPRIKNGMKTNIRLEAIPNKVYHGEVEEISSLAVELSPEEAGANAQPGKKTFKVTVRVKETDPKNLKPGMTADVEFIEGIINSAVYVPIECVVEQANNTYVYIKNGDNYKRAKVETGRHNDNFIIITKGVKKGQEVALRDPTRSLDAQESGASLGGDKAEESSESKEQKAAAVPASNKDKK